jgi:hypothetical protein
VKWHGRRNRLLHVYAPIACLGLAGISALLIVAFHAGHGGAPRLGGGSRVAGRDVQDAAHGGSPIYNGATAGNPGFYVVIAYAGTPRGRGAYLAEVRRAGSGAVTAILPPLPSGWHLGAGVSASTDPREFFVRATTAGCSAASASSFFRFGVNGAGQISGFGPVGPQVHAFVSQFSVSPNASRIAFTTGDCGVGPNGANAQQAAVHVMTLSSGRVVTWWNDPASGAPVGAVAAAGPMSWTQNGRMLAVEYQWIQGDPPYYLRVLGINADSPGGPIQAHARVLLSQGANCGTCVYQALIDPSGTALTVTAMRQLSKGKPFAEYQQSVLTMALTAHRSASVLFTSTRSGCGVAPILYAAGSDQSWILQSGVQLGTISGGRLVPLPPGTGWQLHLGRNGCSLVRSGPLVTGIAW